MTKSRRIPVSLLVFAAALAVILAVRPWTVRPIGWREAQTASAGTASAEDIWRMRVESADYRAIESAGDLGDAPAFVTGVGVIVRLDTQSSVGQAFVDLVPQDGAEDLVMQIGPIVRGSAIRDAAGLGFADFDSQMAYARAAAALNRMALAEAGLPADPGALLSAKVEFAGAIAGGDALPRELTPTRVQIVEP